jgi:hypothetical protein
MEEPESFIVQNVTMNYHWISDIRLQFDPLAVIDLTWEDPKVIMASKDLRNALRQGYLRKISQEEWDKKQEKQLAKEKKELLKSNPNARMQTIESEDGKTLEAEVIDAERPYKRESELSNAGYANDPLSYAVALEVAQTQAELNGDELSVEEFAERVKRDAGLVGRLVNAQTNSVVSGSTRKGQAYVAQAPGSGQSESTIGSVKMSNFGRDGYLAGSEASVYERPSDDFGFDDMPAIAEEIDLELDGDAGSEKGSVRRV